MALHRGLILLVAGLLAMTSRAGPATTAASKPTTAHYGGPDVAFSLDYPAIWKLETNGPNVIRLRPQPGTEDSTYHMYITVVERPLGAKETLKALVDHDREDMSDRWGGLKIVTDRETQVGKVSGWVCDYEYPRTGGTIWKVIRYFAVDGKCAYSFTVNEQKLDAERALPDVRAVLESLTLNPGFVPTAMRKGGATTRPAGSGSFR